MKNGRADTQIKDLQLQILRIQQGIWHQKKRAIIVFEGFDAAGKGGAIRRITEPLDPRGYQVHPIGAPEKIEHGKHYLYRFWTKLPAPGTIAIFDRSWYGRVLVEKVCGLAPKDRIQEAYEEICQFEEMLLADGIDLVKIFLAIDKKEQLKRFEDRLRDPYKQWKISEDDVKARAQWQDYVRATDLMLEKTSFKNSPWHLIPANDKDYARVESLNVIVKSLKTNRDWMTRKIQKAVDLSLEMALEELGLEKESLK
ncbi:polyphosphate kinase 2 family protein [Bdellovibrio sp. HCB337]|uniref:polyphosphate kinase 2 family protein n=1 Tax=Bdellovibrio sp. HCB337 TaxID=3394358 RepID=UPI0039A4101E